MNAVLQWGLSLLQKTPLAPEKAVVSDAAISVNTTIDRASDHVQRTLVIALLTSLRGGRLALFEEGKVQTFGAWNSDDDVNACVNILDSAAWRLILTRGTMGAAEAYMAGYWTSPDPVQVIRLMLRNRAILNGLDDERSLFARLALKAVHAMNRNTLTGSQKNIHAHYDLGNDFFSLFLDQTMMYSSAVFRQPNESLTDAAVYKLDMVCRQLLLKPGDHLLEIGSGWGGMAIHAAKYYGCHVTTTTISQAQYDFAKKRIEAEGLTGYITLLLQDYRELEGCYDKLVSIEMIEAVGAEFQPTFFATCNRLLRPGGMALIQAITIRDDLYEQYLDSTDFIRQYIFPGGCLPTLTRMKQLARKHTSMELLAVTDITLDYARTLNHWRQRFLFNIRQVMAQGFDLAFIRRWDFYFCYCEGGFLESSIGTQQMLFEKMADT